MIIFRIKEIREKQNITGYKLAKLCGMSRSYLCDLENNHRFNPSLDKLLEIAKILNVNVKDLFYTSADINNLKEEMYKRIEIYGINSNEALEVFQLIDLLINIKLKKE